MIKLNKIIYRLYFAYIMWSVLLKNTKIFKFTKEKYNLEEYFKRKKILIQKMYCWQEEKREYGKERI